MIKKPSICNIAHCEGPLKEINLRDFVEPLKVFQSPHLDIIHNY